MCLPGCLGSAAPQAALGVPARRHLRDTGEQDDAFAEAVCINAYRVNVNNQHEGLMSFNIHFPSTEAAAAVSEVRRSETSHLDILSLLHFFTSLCKKNVPLCDVTKGGEAFPGLDSLPCPRPKSLKSLFFPPF